MADLSSVQSAQTIRAESSWLHRLLAGVDGVSVAGEMVRIHAGWRGTTVEIPMNAITGVALRPTLFGNTLELRLGNHTGRSIGGLRKDGATSVHHAVKTHVVAREQEAARLREEAKKEAARLRAKAEKEAASQVAALSSAIRELDDLLRRLFDGSQYVRHSASLRINASVRSTIRACQEDAVRIQSLAPGTDETLQSFAQAQKDLLRIEHLVATESFEATRQQANANFVRSSLAQVKTVAAKDRPIDLTSDQAAAVATDEDATLVLAGAGSGKTAVITSKVAHLVLNQGVPPEEILVLAFNSKAAKEVRERLPVHLSGANVFTFHALGHRVIGYATGKMPTISVLAEDENKLAQAIQISLRDLVRSPQDSDKTMDFVAYHPSPYRSPFTFKTKGDYDKYTLNSERRTLSGDRVKSFEELVIANFLTMHGIEFRYEKPYPESTATNEYRQYKPDFYLPDYDLYIEHFALDRNGNPHPNWHRYKEGVAWKRQIHRRYGTRLIETYSWQHSESQLLSSLRRQLEAEGVQFRRIPVQELVHRLGEWLARLISWLARLIITCLHHVKTSRLPLEELRKRANSTSDSARTHGFLDTFEKVKERYDALLAEEGALDFHDLINQATDLLRDGKCPKPYRYILVDEFQDISAGRMDFLKALGRDDTAYFLVGDDWQSIYRFAGSDVGLVRNCGGHLGHLEQCELEQTFRFADGILKPSMDFIRCNPAQTQRHMRPVSPDNDQGITIVPTNISNSNEKQVPSPDLEKGQELGVRTALQDIQKQATTHGNGDPSVLVLGRYRDSLNPLRRYSLPNVELGTVHASKGQEADYVIVLDLKDTRRGFPSKIEDDPLLALVTPPEYGAQFPYAEERRLFYVAMTRARRGAYLVADRNAPSEFVIELCKSHNIRCLGKLEGYEGPGCPRCLGGALVASQSGDNLRCTNYPLCDHLAPRCPNCGQGYAVVAPGLGPCTCTNPACHYPLDVCPQCGVGVIIVKEGRYGPFRGCNGFWLDPPCTYTRNM